MEALIQLLIQFLPEQVKAIELLKYLPDAVDTVKKLTALVNKSIVILKQGPLTPDQEAVLDATIASLSSRPHWQPKDPTGQK